MRASSFISQNVLSAFVFMAATGCGVQAGSAAEAMATHRAIYDLRVVESPGKTGISSGDGRLVYEFKRDQCHGFTLAYRQVMNVKPTEGSGSTIDFRSTTFESDSADLFRFENKNIVNGTEDTALKGEAGRTSEGIKITMSEPEPSSEDIKKPALFPTEHMKAVVKAALSGKTLLEASVFDGSGKADSLTDTLTLIGKASTSPPEDLEAVARKAGLEKQKYWPVTISYFDNAVPVTEQTPKFVFKADLYENGVTRDLTLNYGSFVVKGKLVGLEYLADTNQQDCGR